MRKRKLKKIGGSYFIQLTHEDLSDKGWEEGDELNIDEIEKVKK